MELGRVLEAGVGRLLAGGVGSARLEARLLLGRVAGVSKVEVLAHPEREVGPAVEAAFEALVARRLAGEPVAYLLGEREFYGRVFRVDRRVLVPRPETELLVRLGVAAARRWQARGLRAPTVVDVGTGSGAIGVSVALETGVAVTATDVSAAALDVARDNARTLGAGGLLTLRQADLLDGVPGPIHVLLANLPYVPDCRALPREVADYEPHVALFGGPSGRELNERLLRQAQPLLAPGGEVFLEIDEEGQALPLAHTARTLYPDAEVAVLRDDAGAERVLRARCARGVGTWVMGHGERGVSPS